MTLQKTTQSWSPYLIWRVKLWNLGFIFIYVLLWTFVTFNIALPIQCLFLPLDLDIEDIITGFCIVLTLLLCNELPNQTDESKVERSSNLENKIPYWDIWETQAAHLQQQYYTYYTYIWEHWHEMEERLLWISCTRATLIGL